MKWSLKYFRSFVMGMQNAMEYRSNFLLSIFSAVFPVIIQLFLWTAVFSSTPGKIVYGYTYPQMITYTILAGIISKLIATGFEWEVADDIKNGGLNKFIIKPIGYFQYRISCFLGQKTVQTVMVIVITAVILLILSNFLGLVLEAGRIALFLLVVFLALMINFLFVFCMSTLAFWFNEVWGVFIAGNLFVNIISGGIFPLDVFGKRVIRLFDFLPFKYMIYYPANVLSGRTPLHSGAGIVLIQLFWIGVFMFLSKLLWSSGTRKYVAVGG